jgi:hypothetical protein
VYLILYKKYTKRSNFAQPFQYDYFRRYLHTLKINKSLLSSLCPHCELFAELENKTERTDSEELKYQKTVLHKENTQKQQFFYYQIKQNLSPTEIIVVMDFSGFDLIQHSMQDLIVG